MTEALFIILMIVIGLLAIVVFPQWRLRRATPKVIQIFREHNAVGIKNAKTPDELGLKLPSMMQEIFSRRDYKRYALKGLISTGIIQMTEDGRLYLSEEKLFASKLYKS